MLELQKTGGNPKAQGREFWLDVLRVMLCIGVFTYHYTPERPGSGPVCVDGFFVLSGYLLAAGFARMQAAGGMDVCAFYRSKARRLLPTLLASLLFGFLFYTAHYFFDPEDNQILYTWSGCDFHIHCLMRHYNTPSWFMASEMACLGLAPLLFLCFNQGKWFILTATLVMAGFTFILYENVPYAEPFGEGLYFEPQVRLWQFLAGMLAWMVFHNVTFRPWMKVLAGVLFAATAVFLYIFCTNSQKTDLGYVNYTFWFDFLMVALYFLLVPALTKLPAPGSSRLRRVLAYLALLSYPVYLYHYMVLEWVHFLTYELSKEVFDWHLTFIQRRIICITLTLALSALSLRYLDGLFAKKKTTPAP